ncbi:MAG: ROK family protein [Aerococcus sp.]|nr:ROK family protein [Aerococcus sp.]
MQVLVIDIGGTAIKYNLFDAKGTPIETTHEEPTQIDFIKGTNHILDQVLTITAHYAPVIEGVAISSAGVVDAQKGEIAYAGPTIPAYQGTAFKQAIQDAFQLPASVENDVSCAALGEVWRGAAKDQTSAVCLTLGTGIGGAVVLNGEIWHGYAHTAGEVGYLPINGHAWQEIASTTALCQRYSERAKVAQVVDGRYILAQYDAGEVLAKQVLEETMLDFSLGLASICYLINPERIIVGGGIMARSDVLLPMIKTSLSEVIQGEIFLPKDIVASPLGNDANQYGALYHFLKEIVVQP